MVDQVSTELQQKGKGWRSEKEEVIEQDSLGDHGWMRDGLGWFH